MIAGLDNGIGGNKEFFEKLSQGHSALGRYASKELIDKGYDSLGSGGS
jgi:hypothetical protein